MMEFKHIFSYKHTSIRLLCLIVTLIIARIDSIFNYADIMIVLPGAIAGAIVAEMIIRVTFYAINN